MSLIDVDVIPEPVDRFFNIITDSGYWKRVGVIAAGVTLVIIGTVILVSGTRAVKDLKNLALSVGSKVVTKGAV